MLDIQTEVETIGDATYHVQPLPAGAALKMLARIGRAIMPVLGEGATLLSRDRSKPVTVSDLVTVGRMLEGVVESLDDATVEYLHTTLAPTTKVEHGGKKLALETCFHEHFRGRLVECLLWLKFALKVTYGPLVERAGQELTRLVASPPAKEG